MRNDTKELIGQVIIPTLMLVIYVAVCGVVGYVAFHFVRKLW